MDGTVILKDSPEDEDQRAILDRKREEQQERDQREAVDVEVEEYEGEAAVKNTLRNQFNFSERASQTFNQVLRERGISTEPPPSSPFTAVVTQWTIYDTYMKEIDKEKTASEKEKQKANTDK